MGPEKPLPYKTNYFQDTDDYVDSLFDLVTNDGLLRVLCGGVHVLDFFTSDPDLYSRILPQEWRDFFQDHEVMDLLDLFMREDVDVIADDVAKNWRNGPRPPRSLLNYICTIRKHALIRDPAGSHCARNRMQKKLARHVAVGMNVKKVHEVGLFASYVDRLATDIANTIPDAKEITHLVDFGSGQSYLGRALASEPYNRDIVAIESKAQNTERARFFDAAAKIAEKDRVFRNKKAYRSGLIPADQLSTRNALPTPPSEGESMRHGAKLPSEAKDMPSEAQGRIQHIKHRIQNGDLSEVIPNISFPGSKKNVMVMSLHSCGNLVHHGLRSLVLNPDVKAVAMIGCCYNLLTERLGPATYKLPDLRPTTHAHPRLEKLGEECDPDGFPMSNRLCNYGGTGVRLNITARMMAVQAPENWGRKDSESFFTRHFYRALLQRIFLDRGVVGPPRPEYEGSTSAAGHSSGGTPILIGSLKKGCYDKFVTYTRGALAKLYEDPVLGALMKERMSDISDAEIAEYEERYRERKKDLSVTWSLMACSASAIEAAIAVDRWLWLEEQECVKEAWVESVFEYGISPRNLVVVGLRK